MRRVLQRVLPQRPDPSGPPLQPHVLRSLPGANVQDKRGDLQRLLPSVPLDYLHTGQSDPARRPVGQHGDLGPDYRGEAAEHIDGGFEKHKDTTQVDATLFETVRVHVHAPESVQLRAGARTRDGRLLTVSHLKK